MRKSRLLALLLVTAAACHASGNATEPLGPHDIKVLFVGNSLTSVNDLPGAVSDLAHAGGYAVGVQTLAIDNTALIDFLSIGAAMAVIDGTNWNYVVLQQGTTSLPVCRDTLVLAAQLLNPHMRAHGGVPALMMSWPSISRLSVFPAVHDSYALAAQTIDGLAAPPITC